MSTSAAKVPMSNKKYMSIWIPVLAFALVLVVGANIALQIYGSWVATQLGTGTYTITNAEATDGWDTQYTAASYDSLEAAQADAGELVSEIESEGVVLAKNEAAALPLESGARVTLLGRFSADPVYGGSGSGSVDTSTAVNAYDGLTNAGLVVNDTAYALFEDFVAAAPKANIVMDKPEESSYVIGEMPVAQYTDEVTASFEDLVGELSTRSEDFRTRWAAHDVHLHRAGTKLIQHPVVGRLELMYDTLHLPADPGQTMLVYTAEPGSPSADALVLLASWAATLEQTERTPTDRHV